MNKRLVATARLFEVLLAVAAIFTVYRFLEWRNRSELVTGAALEIPANWVSIKSKLNLPGAAWSPRNVVLFASVDCPRSRQSIGLYQELSRAAHETKWRLIAVTATMDRETPAWLTANNVEADQFIEVAELAAFGIWATPTLLLVDETGTVTDAVTGGLTAKQETLLWSRLNDRAATPLNNTFTANEYDIEEYSSRIVNSDPQFVDPGKRSEFQRTTSHGVRNIPLQEFAERVDVELDRQRPVAVDCRRGYLIQCRIAAVILNNLGFKDISVIKPLGLR